MFWFAAVNPVLTPASPQARALSDLFVVTLIVCGVIFLLVAGLITWSALRFRHRGSASEPKQVDGNTKLEITWTLAAILILAFLFALTVRAARLSDPPAEREPDVTVIGHQWWWEVRYPDGTTTANEIHIPTQKDILVRVESADVIHSLWLPRLGRKMDAIPGHPNSMWIRADQAGEYTGTCSEFCGAQHAWMRVLLVAQSPAEFRQWLSREAQPAPSPTTPTATRGQALFREKTCINCHTIRDTNAGIQVGPELTHFATRQTIGAGVLQNTPVDLRRWLTDPQAIKPGCYMPNFHLTQTEVEDLAAFLETLK